MKPNKTVKREVAPFQIRGHGILDALNAEQYIQSLKAGLKEAAKPKGRLLTEKPEETKKRLLAVLRLLEEFVEIITEEYVEDSAGEVIYVSESHASSLMRRLVKALEEIHDGIIDPIFKAPGNRNKAIPAYECEERDALCKGYGALRKKGLPKKECIQKIANRAPLPVKKVNTMISNAKKPKGSKTRRK